MIITASTHFHSSCREVHPGVAQRRSCVAATTWS